MQWIRDLHVFANASAQYSDKLAINYSVDRWVFHQPDYDLLLPWGTITIEHELGTVQFTPEDVSICSFYFEVVEMLRLGLIKNPCCSAFPFKAGTDRNLIELLQWDREITLFFPHADSRPITISADLFAEACFSFRLKLILQMGEEDLVMNPE